MRLSFSKNTAHILTIICLIIFPHCSYSQIQVNSVNTTPITCPNNGSVTISATTTSPPLLYSIIAGPMTQPVQTNPVFNSLLPGNYTIRISDGAGNQTNVNAIISGTYLNPDFTISPTTPYCSGQSNGKLVAVNIPGTGSAPFSWQLIAPSPVTTGVQNNGTFENLPAGNYSIRITDACGSFSTKAFVLQNPDTRFSFLSVSPGQPGEFIYQKIGCDSMLVTYWLNIPLRRFPLTFKYRTSNGVYIPTSGTTVDTTSLQSTGQVMVSQIIPGIDYGDQVAAIAFNTCGDSAFSMPITAHPFVFYPKYAFNDCGLTANVSFTNTPYQNFHTSINTDAHYTFTHVSTNTVIASGTVSVQQNNGIIGITPSVNAGETYHFSITDGCGETFQSNFTVPALAPPVIINEGIVGGACIDSVVGTYRILTSGFAAGAKLILLSGPATLGSTKPEFEYSDTYTYPDIIEMFNGESFMMDNLAAGTYQYKIIDECGNEIPGSITITPNQVTSLRRAATVKKGCPGHNKILFSMINGGNVVIRNTATNTIVKNRDFVSYTDNNQASIYNKDSVINLTDGTYEVTFSFQGFPGSPYVKNVNDSDIPCWIIVDTLVIEPYQFPQITTGNAIMCNNAINLALITDTTKGVAPYQYEIISGPQTFGVQPSSIFTVSQPGTYLARIFDACGNASTKQITVDTISFDPIEVQSTCFSTSMYFPASIYSTYQWIMPNGQTHVGDSLILNPVTPADTGTYYISKITSINGCIDTFQTTYHVALNNYIAQTIPFCAGTDVQIGTNIYNTPGIYTDTLTSVFGCDSIVVTTLAILPQHSDTTQITICQGDSIQIHGQYQHIAGFYLDSVQNSFGCYNLLVTSLSISHIIDTVDVSICQGGNHPFGGNIYVDPGFYSDTLTSVSGCDSISVLHLTVMPYIQHSFSESICTNQSFLFGGNLLTMPGIYTDTLSTATCDSIVTLTLSVLPHIYHTVNQTICEGDQFPFGGNLLSQAGTYTDTLATLSCDSIVTLNLTVSPLKYHSFSQTLCEGQSFSFGGSTYTASGIYTDTLPTSTCDSIVTLTLNVLPLKHHAINATICAGQEYTFAGNHYTQSGTYTHIFQTSQCDSIVTLHLTVNPAPTVQILSSSYETGNGIFVQLNAISNTSPLTYLWASSSILSNYTIPNPTTTVQVPTWVYVTVTDANGCSSTTGNQVPTPVVSTLYAPNAFTPNGDEANNVFFVYGTHIAEFKVTIYDRWGELIFESTDINAGWDGTYKGKIVQDDTYVYKISAVGMDYVKYEKTGHVTVIK